MSTKYVAEFKPINWIPIIPPFIIEYPIPKHVDIQ